MPRKKRRVPGVPVEWSHREGWLPFGNRLHFLSPEKQHLETGGLRLLPPKGEKKRGKE